MIASDIAAGSSESVVQERNIFAFNGSTLFQKHCRLCHGVYADGNGRAAANYSLHDLQICLLALHLTHIKMTLSKMAAYQLGVLNTCQPAASGARNYQTLI